MICEKLGFSHVPYNIAVVNQKIVSKCPCFIDTQTELVTAHQILHNTCNKSNAYEDYIKILEEHGISDARKNMENMLLLDFLIMNEDRHYKSVGWAFLLFYQSRINCISTGSWSEYSYPQSIF